MRVTYLKRLIRFIQYSINKLIKQPVDQLRKSISRFSNSPHVFSTASVMCIGFFRKLDCSNWKILSGMVYSFDGCLYVLLVMLHGIGLINPKPIICDRFRCSTSDHKTDHHAQKKSGGYDRF